MALDKPIVAYINQQWKNEHMKHISCLFLTVTDNLHSLSTGETHLD